MGHIPEDENFDEFMNASAEEWSKPEKTPPQPEVPGEGTDRWGSPIAGKGSTRDADRWGSEPLEPTRPDRTPKEKKSGARWWIIAIVIVVALCLCLCLTLLTLSALGVALPFGGLGLYELFQ